MSPLRIAQPTSPAPSVDHLLDSTCSVYRVEEYLNDLREKLNRYTLVVTGLPVYIIMPRNAREDEGAGEAPVGLEQGLAGFGADLIDEDVITLDTGPCVGLCLRISGVNRPRSHHVEFYCEHFNPALIADAVVNS